jgi:hypothetical protein
MMFVAKLSLSGNLILSNVNGIILYVLFELIDVLDILEGKYCKELSAKHLFCK